MDDFNTAVINMNNVVKKLADRLHCGWRGMEFTSLPTVVMTARDAGRVAHKVEGYDRLKELFAQFANHKPGCMVYYHPTRGTTLRPCSCGYDEAKKEIAIMKANEPR